MAPKAEPFVSGSFGQLGHLLAWLKGGEAENRHVWGLPILTHADMSALAKRGSSLWFALGMKGVSLCGFFSEAERGGMCCHPPSFKPGS